MVVTSLLAISATAFAQATLQIPADPGFEQAAPGGQAPLGWTPGGSSKSIQTWETEAHTGQRCVAIEQSDANDTGSWTSQPAALQPNREYIVAVWYRCRSGDLGPPEVLIDGNDFYLSAPTEWTYWVKRFRTKPETTGGTVTLWMNYRPGQKAFLDDVLLCPADRISWPQEPATGAVVQGDGNLRLRWTAVPGAAGYGVWLSPDRGFPVGSIARQTATTELAVDEPLARGKWYWRVTAMMPDNGPPIFTPTASFLLVSPEPPLPWDTTPPLVWKMQPVRDGVAGSARPMISVRLDDGDRSPGDLAVTWRLDGRDRTPRVRRRGDRAWVRPEAPLVAGRHTSEIQVRDQGGNTTTRAWAFFVGEKPTSTAQFDRDLALRFNDLPFFPLGLYSYAHQQHLEEIQRCGMNTILSESEGSREYLDDLLKHNLKILLQARGTIVGPDDEAGIRARAAADGRVTSLRNHPALLGYWTDEAEGEGAPVNRMLLGYNVFKGLDPDHPFMACLCNRENFGPYSAVADGIVPDPYPSPHSPVSVVAGTMDAAARAIEGNKPVWIIPQAFDWHVAATGEVAPGEVFRPTGEEMRCMTYLALLHGAKGVLYWASDSGKCDIVNFPERWKALQETASEVAWLSPVIERPKEDLRATVEPPDAPVDIGIWRDGDAWYVIAANTSTEACEVTLTLPPEVTHGHAKVMFENRQTHAQGAIQDVFRPLEVHVYVIG